MNNKDLDKILSDRLDKWEEKAKTAIKWIAVDPNGSVWGYSTKPKIETFGGFWDCDTDCICFGKTDDKYLLKHWDKTLRKVNYEQ